MGISSHLGQENSWEMAAYGEFADARLRLRNDIHDLLFAARRG